MFHVSIEVGNSRESWHEEMDAIKALLLTAYEKKTKDNIQFARLSELAEPLGKPRPSNPMNSILRAG